MQALSSRTTKKSIFICQIESLQELDWIIPIIWKLRKDNTSSDASYKIFLPVVPPHYKSRHTTKVLSDYKIEFFFPHNIIFGKSTTNKLRVSSPYLSKITELLYKLSYKNKKFYNYYLKFFIKMLGLYMKEYDASFFFPLASLRESLKNIYIEAFYNYSLMNNKITIGFDTHGFSKENRLIESDSKFSMILTRWNPSNKDLVINPNCEYIGSPRFEKEYIKDNINRTNCYINSSINKRFNNKQKNVLFLLKKATSTILSISTKEEINQYREWVISYLFSKNYNIIIKPHPRENLTEINTIINRQSNATTQKPIVYYGSTYSALGSCSLVFCEFATEANLDVLSYGLQPIWPYRSFRSDLDDASFDILVEKIINSGTDPEFFNNIKLGL